VYSEAFVVLAVLLGGAGAAALVVYLVSVPTALGRIAGVLGVSALASVLVGLIWLLLLWAKWRAGYSCPDRSSGPGQVSHGGVGNATTCRYVQGGSIVADHQDPGWFFDPWLVAGTLVLTLVIVLAAVQISRSIWRERGATDQRVRFS
jgi:hypothetical protein